MPGGKVKIGFPQMEWIIIVWYFRIALDEDLDLDIPTDMTSIKEYNATLGHKVTYMIIEYVHI